MQVAPSIFSVEQTREVTIAAHTQAVERAIQIMHTHMGELLTLEDLAAVAYLSPFHFNRVFRRLIGIPPGEFLSALRFQAARRLLLTTSLSVTDVCFEVGYTSTGSFTSRFTQLVGLSPRHLRRRAHEFEPLQFKPRVSAAPASISFAKRTTVSGQISAPEAFQGTIYVGLFTSPVPQGKPARCTRLMEPGAYQLSGLADGVYYLRAAAFPKATDLQACLMPGEKMLVGQNPVPLIIYNGHIAGDPNLVLHTPRLTDPPLVLGLPLL